MDSAPSRLDDARRIQRLARASRESAQRALAKLDLEGQVAVICEAPASERPALLGLVPRPEDVIPRLPEAELCFTVKAAGLGDASWLLEHSTKEQLAACFDLDAWSGFAPDPVAMDGWLESLAHAGEATLLRTAQHIDPELIVLMLRSHAQVIAKPAGDDAQSWEEPVGAHTLDGQFYLVPHREGDDLAPLLSLLDTLFRLDYWLYYRMLQGVIWEMQSDLEEWALRWRSGRLEDLGFPSWDESMRIYGSVRPEARDALPEEAQPLDVSEWKLPIWLPGLPLAEGAEHAVFRAAAQLEDSERRAFFFAFVGLANKVAVADGLPLGDAETTPAAIEKAAVVVSRGLEWIAQARGLDAVEVLRRAPLQRLFRVGASLEPVRRKD